MPQPHRVEWAKSPRTYLFAAAVGLIGGLAGTVFQASGRAVQHVIIGTGTLLEAAKELEWYQALLIPFGGAIAAALLSYALTRKRPSQGMSDVMEAVTLNRAKSLSVRATISRAMLSFALIVTGSSIGREGPIVYMSASFGSRFARWMRVPVQRLGIYAGCGIAAGMSASYFAPLGAALFAAEVVLGNFALEVMAPVIIASITANMVMQALARGPLSNLLHTAPLFELPEFKEGHPFEMLVYLFLGVAAAFAGWLFIKAMSEAARLFRKSKLPAWAHLPIGGLCIGLIGIWLPEIWGNGYHAVNIVLKEEPLLRFVAVLFVMKIVATSITLGSGGSGGIFTPTLFVGVALGMTVGTAAHALFPGIVADPRPYAVVGMASTIASTTQAPITAIFLLFEMTRETQVILPLMVAVMSASLTSRWLGLDSVYVEGMRRRGVQIPEGIEETTLTTTRVTDIMRSEAVWVNMGAGFDMIVGMFQKTRHDCIYVTGRDDQLRGVIRLHDVKNFLTDAELGPAVIGADLAVEVPHAAPNQTLAEVMPYFDDPEMNELPVVDPESGRLLGSVDRRDVISQLSVEVLQSPKLRAKFVEHEGAQHYVEIPKGHAVSRIPVPPEMAGKTLAQIGLRQQTGLTALAIIRVDQGQETRIVPQANTMVLKDDALIVMGPIESIERMGGTV
jgi:CIC family chloride channel protein